MEKADGALGEEEVTGGGTQREKGDDVGNEVGSAGERTMRKVKGTSPNNRPIG